MCSKPASNAICVSYSFMDLSSSQSSSSCFSSSSEDEIQDFINHFMMDDDLDAAVLEYAAMEFFEDDDFQPSQNSRGGSRPGKKPNKQRDFEGAYQDFMKMYFCDTPVYDDRDFRRRFRMRKPLFERIFRAVVGHDPYFEQRKNCTNKMGAHGLLKVIGALRMLSYGFAADALDEVLKLSETVISCSLMHFVDAIIDLFEEEYLRDPTEADIVRLVNENTLRGFPGMLGSIDCMHWTWKNCPVAWRGALQGKEKVPTIVLEAVSSADTWIWHAFIGTAGSNNDINVLDRSTLISKLCNGGGEFRHSFDMNSKTYYQLYFLAVIISGLALSGSYC